ncbi:MAG: ribonuclease P protein component [Verrucomicrobiota bacterium]|nr:ribonuclease P protein component [Limisphaera sp.]MDW8381856.1 ribonuclease P protein component [Verrucomicrobiota bacterium]
MRQAAEAGGFRLRKHQRLKLGRDFLRLRNEGGRVAQGCLIVNWLPRPEGQRSRIAVVAGRKLGRATVRNRARRLLREVFRLHQWDLAPPVDLVLVARPSIVDKGYGDVEADFLLAMRRAGLLKEQRQQLESPLAKAQDISQSPPVS